MSPSDQVKNKLLDSMRASKQVPKDSQGSENEVSEKKPAPANKAKAAKTIKAAKRAVPEQALQKEAGLDSFQAVKRVWPD